MRKLKYSFHRIALNQIYMSHVLPILEYSCTVWGGRTVQYCLALERLQNEAARIVTGLTVTGSVSLENLYRECGWHPLSERRMKNKLVFMYNVVYEIVPSYISDLIPPLVIETTQYPLKIITISCFHLLVRKFLVDLVFRLLYHYGIHSNMISAKHNMSTRLKTNVRNINFLPRRYHFDGERHFSVMHARMRNKCSNLKHDLYSNHLVQSPFCNCADVSEDAEHFCFKCTNFTRERIALFHATRNLHPLNLNKVLLRDENLSVQDNKSLFKGIQTYIKSTRRFNNPNEIHFIFIFGIALWMSLSAVFPDEVLFTYLFTYFTYLLILLRYRKLYDLSAKVSAYFLACNLLPFLSSLLKNVSLYVLCVCIYLYICFQYGFS